MTVYATSERKAHRTTIPSGQSKDWRPEHATASPHDLHTIRGFLCIVVNVQEQEQISRVYSNKYPDDLQ